MDVKVFRRLRKGSHWVRFTLALRGVLISLICPVFEAVARGGQRGGWMGVG